MSDPRDRHLSLLQASIRQALDEIRFSHSELVWEQFEASRPSEYNAAALICLRAAEAAGGSAEAALPGATALALLAQMGLVFSNLESQNGAASLSTAWGMPRALNTGDALFAAAQHCLLASAEELTAEQRLEALRVLDETTRAYCEVLNVSSGDDASSHSGETVLASAALGLGGLLGGADSKTLARLGAIGASWASLTPEELESAVTRDLGALLSGAC